MKNLKEVMIIFAMSFFILFFFSIECFSQEFFEEIKPILINHSHPHEYKNSYYFSIVPKSDLYKKYDKVRIRFKMETMYKLTGANMIVAFTGAGDIESEDRQEANSDGRAEFNVSTEGLCLDKDEDDDVEECKDDQEDSIDVIIYHTGEPNEIVLTNVSLTYYDEK